MKKILNLFLAVLMIFSISAVKNIYAQNNKNIDIGLKFADTAVSEAGFKVSGLALNDGLTSKYVNSQISFTVRPVAEIYVDDVSYSDYTSVSLTDGDFVFVKDLSGYYKASLKNKYKNKLQNAVAVYDSSNNIIFALDGKSDLTMGSSDFSPFEIFKKKYRGNIKLINNSGKLTVINTVGMEDYLYGVLPSEIYSKWNMEALKAQAVAARSFAYSNYNKFAKYGFNLTDDARSQMYKGYNNENQNTSRAVDETKGIVGMYGGKVAELIYNASSGGYTVSAKDVWGSDVPYLISKEDPFSRNNEHSNWSFIMNKAEIEKILKNSNKDIGSLNNITIDETTKGGHVLKLTFHGTKGEAVYTKDAVRWALGSGKLKGLLFKVSGSADEKNISSGSFVLLGKYIDERLVENKGKNTQTESSYIFLGSGYGHGVGMSQYGAQQMAKEGYKFDKILEFYYPGISLEAMN